MQRVHPEITSNGKKGQTLKKKILHFYCKSVFDLFFQKLNSYSTAKAKDLKDHNNNESHLSEILDGSFLDFEVLFFEEKVLRRKNLGLVIAIIAIYPILSYLKYKTEYDND